MQDDTTVPTSLTENGPSPEDVRLEYSSMHEYHLQTILLRFTVVGLYLAAFGFLTQLTLGTELSNLQRILVCTIGIVTGVCIWIMELRSRTLYTAAAKRLTEIERIYWYKEGHRLYEGSVSRLYKFRPSGSSPEQDASDGRPGPERPKLAWMKQPLPEWLSWHLTYSMMFDILYPSTILFWVGVLVWG